MGKIKIYGGKHANRQIQFVADGRIRPTGVRVRKTLFDWLRPMISGKACLDLFSGSGILAFEAMSQGASHVHCIEKDRAVCDQIRSEAARIGEHAITVQCAKFPVEIINQYDLCFMDPPFEEQKLYESSIHSLMVNNVICQGGHIYVESASPLSLNGLVLVKQKQVGNVFMHLFQVGGCDEK